MALAAFTVMPLAAQADTPLTANVGWQEDVVNVAGGLSALSSFTFTIDPGFTGSFALSDAYVPGDVYSVKLFSTDEGKSVFGLYGDSYFNNSLGLSRYTAAWDDLRYSHCTSSEVLRQAGFGFSGEWTSSGVDI